MISPFFRTSLKGSALITRATFHGVSRVAVRTNSNILSREVALPHTTSTCMRSFATSFSLRAAASKPKPKPTTAKKTEPKKKVTAAKKKPALKRTAPKKKASPKGKKVVKPKEPKIYKKDMTPPFKRPLSSWIKFLNEYYEKHKPTGERAKFAEYIQEASAEWKQLSDEQKATYRSSPDEWEVYHKKFEEWKSNLSPAVKSAIRKAKKKNRRLGQKAPLSSWVQFVKESFRTTQFPSEASDAVKKLAYMRELFVTQVTEAEKQALSQRAIKEFEEKQFANT